MRLSELREAINKGWPVQATIGPFVVDTEAYGINIESVRREEGHSEGVVRVSVPLGFEAEEVVLREERNTMRRHSLSNLLSGNPYEGPPSDIED